MMAPSVYQRTKSPQASSTPLHKLQNGGEFAERERGAAAAVVGAEAAEGAETSPSNSISDGENFECVGEAEMDRRNGEVGNRSPNSAINRHSWTRTSLRRTPPSHQDNLPHRRWGSMRHSGKRQLGSNVLASQLYRSSSFNSSGCGSAGEPADDMYSDVSLEEDVQGLNYKVQLLQQQVTTLADTQSSADERYARAKSDNAVLQARVHMLDEQIREIECRCEERLAEEQRRCREAVARVERDRDQQLSALGDRLALAESDAGDLKQEVGRLRGVAEGLRMGAEAEARRSRDAQDQLADLTQQLQQARDQERKQREMALSGGELVAELQAEVERLRRQQTCAALPTTQPDLLRLEELQRELADLRRENNSLRAAQEELQAQILSRGISEGRSLLDGVSGPLVPSAPEHSLAHELGHMSHDQLDGCETQTEQAIQLEKMQKTLKEQQDVNIQLRTYIDGILLSIVEHYPQLLDIKYQKRAPSS